MRRAGDATTSSVDSSGVGTGREAGSGGVPVGGDRPGGPRSRKGALTRTRLLGAAKVVFEENGFLHARISDISERAGLSYGSFYHYFNSKGEIFREVARSQEGELDANAPTDDATLGTSTGDLIKERFESTHRRYLADYRDELGIMRVVEQMSRHDEHVCALRRARHTRYSDRVAEDIRQLQRLGVADPELDPSVASYALTAMVTRVAEVWFVQGQLDCAFDEGVEQLNMLCMNILRFGDSSSM